MNPYLMSQDEAKLIKPVIIKYNHMGVKCAIRRVWSVKGKHNVRHMARLVGKGLSREELRAVAVLTLVAMVHKVENHMPCIE